MKLNGHKGMLVNYIIRYKFRPILRICREYLISVLTLRPNTCLPEHQNRCEKVDELKLQVLGQLLKSPVVDFYLCISWTKPKLHFVSWTIEKLSQEREVMEEVYPTN